MKKLYKSLSLLILLLSLGALLACGKNTPADKDVGKDAVISEGASKEEISDKEKAGEDEAGPTDESKGTGDKNQPADGDKIASDEAAGKDAAGEEETAENIRDISAAELVSEIKIGWNLGNTLDATGGAGIGSETSWGNPFTTREMIDAVKEAGFNTLRLPTTWEKHLGPAPDYKIDKAWLERVRTIVDYGIENDMFVIINMHHEDWHFPSYDNYESAKAILTSVWAQIAQEFAGYDEHLIFEGMNEPRMKGTQFEWTGGNEEGRDVVNLLNADFVETIRNSGGNNAKRHLMIPTYAASSDPRTWNDFVIPEDDKLIISIHAYTPYNFALNKSGTSVWSLDNANDTREIDYLMENLYNNFVSQGHPVIIGEFGAMDKNNNLESRAAWSEYYVKKAKEKGIPCIWWDNGAFFGGGELFGLLDRRQLSWKYPEVVNALMKGLE